MAKTVTKLLRPDYERYQGVRPINIWLLRVVYFLMASVLAQDVWARILSHQGQWEPLDAMAWSVWAAFSTLALVGLFRPLQMIPILLLEIIYKVMWLWMVAYPLWRDQELIGSAAERMAYGFTWVLLPLIAVPWGYVFRVLILGRSSTKPGA